MDSNKTDATAAMVAEQPKRIDKHIWGIYIMLCIISVIELYSASSHEVRFGNVFAPVVRHVIFLIGGLACMLFLQRTHYKKFYYWIWGFTFFSLCAMVYTIFFGKSVNGATRSFEILTFTVQPSEMIKLSAALIIAAILCREQMKGVADVTTRGVAMVTAVVLISGALLFSEGLTNTLLLMAISLSMMLIGGVSWRKFFIVIGIFVVAGGLGMGAKALMARTDTSTEVVEPVRYMPGTDIVIGKKANAKAENQGGGRFNTWTNRLTRHFGVVPLKQPVNSENQQEQYSYMAQAHGGVLGVMPGNSRETARLPLAFSDYIYAIIIEELGLVGGILVLVLYMWLLARAGRIASRCQTAFPALLVIGMAVFIAFQAMAHMSIVSGVVPVSGQPLPLISKGGTSILMVSIALGIMLSVSRHAARKGDKAEIRQELKTLPDEVKALNPT